MLPSASSPNQTMARFALAYILAMDWICSVSSATSLSFMHIVSIHGIRGKVKSRSYDKAACKFGVTSKCSLPQRLIQCCPGRLILKTTLQRSDLIVESLVGCIAGTRLVSQPGRPRVATNEADEHCRAFLLMNPCRLFHRTACRSLV